MEHLSAISFAVRKGLLAQGESISLGHVQQLVAAALGHNNLASYQASDDDAALPVAKAVAFDHLLLATRAAELGGNDHTVARVLELVLQACFPELDVYKSAASLVEEWHLHCENAIANDDRVNGQTSMTNGTFPQAQDVDLPWWEDFGDYDSDLTHQHEGVVTVDQDPDRVYWGDEVDVSAQITVERFGRRLFGDCEVHVESAKLRWLGHSDESPEPVE